MGGGVQEGSGYLYTSRRGANKDENVEKKTGKGREVCGGGCSGGRL